jgi:hypothetical protein
MMFVSTIAMQGNLGWAKRTKGPLWEGKPDKLVGQEGKGERGKAVGLPAAGHQNT